MSDIFEEKFFARHGDCAEVDTGILLVKKETIIQSREEWFIFLHFYEGRKGKKK